MLVGDIGSHAMDIFPRSLVGLNECLLVLLTLLLIDCSPAVGLVILPVMISFASMVYLLAFSSSVSKHELNASDMLNTSFLVASSSPTTYFKNSDLVSTSNSMLSELACNS